MNTSNYFRPRSGAARVFSWITTFVLVLSLLAFPARAASSQPGALSAELVFASEKMDFSGKLALDIDQQLLAVVAGLGIDGVTLAELGAYLSNQAVAAGGGIIGGFYGVDFASLTQNLPKSIFAPDSGSSYALDEEIYDQIITVLNGGLESIAQYNSFDLTAIADLTDAITVLTDTYSGIAEELILCTEFKVSDSSLSLNNKPIQVAETRVTIDGNAVAEMLDTLIVPLQGSTEAQQALATAIDCINAISDEELGITGEEAVEMIVSQLPELLPELAQDLEDQGFFISFCLCTSADSGATVKYALELEADGDAVAINLLMDENEEFFRFEVMEDNYPLTYMQLDIPENTDDTLVLKFTVQNEYEDAVILDFNLNKAAKAFLVTLEADEEKASISGYYSSAPNQFSMSIDKIDGQNPGGIFSLILRSDDTISMPAFSEITSMTEEELTKLVNQISLTFDLISQMAA